MQIHFAFGKHGLDLALPDGPRYEVIESRSASALPDVKAALDAALDHPIGGKPLVALARGKKTAAISVCDITRPAPNSVTLPPLLRRLHEAGIPVEGVTILIATGLHREATAGEIQAILGPEIAARYRVVNHDARVLAQHRSLGSTRRGIPVYIDERFMAADLHITLGFIEQHLMLGFSGGRKLVAPAWPPRKRSRSSTRPNSCGNPWPRRVRLPTIRSMQSCWKSPEWRVTISCST